MRLTELLVSVGSNIDAFKHVERAVLAMHDKFDNLRCAPVYQSPPVGMLGDDFLNTVVVGDTALPPVKVVDFLRQLEDEAGRDRAKPRFSSRTLDLDLLIYGVWVQQDEQLELPRPEVLEMGFVLQPLADLVPLRVHPVQGKSYRQLREHLFGLQPDQFNALRKISWSPLKHLHQRPQSGL